MNKVAAELVDEGTLVAGNDLPETNNNYTRVLKAFKKEYFDSDTPRFDQIDYIKGLQKPREATWRQFVSAVDYMLADLKYFAEDLDQDGNTLPTDQQPKMTTEEYRDFLLLSAPRAWYDQVTNTGENPRLMATQDIKARFGRLENAEQRQARRERRVRDENECGRGRQDDICDNDRGQGRRGDCRNNNGNGRQRKYCNFCRKGGHADEECNHPGHPRHGNKNNEAQGNGRNGNRGRGNQRECPTNGNNDQGWRRQGDRSGGERGRGGQNYQIEDNTDDYSHEEVRRDRSRSRSWSRNRMNDDNNSDYSDEY